MSILIKGMEMPKSCLLCPFGDEFGKCCVNAELEDAKELTHSCPLVELPDHGDLIDRDVVADALDVMAVHGRLRDAFDMVMSCEAVIHAERSKSDE